MDTFRPNLKSFPFCLWLDSVAVFSCDNTLALQLP